MLCFKALRLTSTLILTLFGLVYPIVDYIKVQLNAIFNYLVTDFNPVAHHIDVECKEARKDRAMDADGVPIVGQSLDLKLLEPLQHKRTLAYINHFVIQVFTHSQFPTLLTYSMLLFYFYLIRGYVKLGQQIEHNSTSNI